MKCPAKYVVYFEQGEGWTFARKDDPMPLKYQYFQTEQLAINAAINDSEAN